MTISEIYTTAPAQASCEAAAKAFALLDELGIPYARVEHDTADTMEDCAAISDVLGIRICKNLVLCNRQKTDFYLLLMDGEKPFRTKDLSKQIGSSRLSFATPEDMEKHLGVTPGSATVLAMMNDKAHAVKLILDKSVAESQRFGCHPCVNTSTLALSMVDIRTKFLPHLGIEPLLVDLPDVREEV